jgi:hypothetical protein
MSVYVDAAFYSYGRMVMCHMLADSTDELLSMADRIGVQRKWLQHPGRHDEHFDICKSKRAMAVKYGAKEINRSGLVGLLRAKREQDREARG